MCGIRTLSYSFITGCLFSIVFCTPATVFAASIDDQIDALLKVNHKGEGVKEAALSLQQLQDGSPQEILPLLKAFQNANPLAANYLQNAVETIAQHALNDKKELPAQALEEFVLNVDNNPHARKIAFDILTEVDESAHKRLIPGMLLDPSSELRRESVQLAIDNAVALQEKESKEAKAAFEKALTGAVDDDQVKAIVKPLEELGVKVDMQKHFGFLSDWKLIGPFDNTDMKGFPVAYPPEKELNFAASYQGKENEVFWANLTSEDDYGIINIAEDIGPYKGAIMYAASEFHAAKPQELQIRLGTPNAWKMWVNGELIFEREEYQRGMALDQYRVPVSFKAGKNQILLKVCQNEMEQSWAQRFQFQLRVCDAVGSAVLSEKP